MTNQEEIKNRLIHYLIDENQRLKRENRQLQDDVVELKQILAAALREHSAVVLHADDMTQIPVFAIYPNISNEMVVRLVK